MHIILVTVLLGWAGVAVLAGAKPLICLTTITAFMLFMFIYAKLRGCGPCDVTNPFPLLPVGS